MWTRKHAWSSSMKQILDEHYWNHFERCRKVLRVLTLSTSHGAEDKEDQVMESFLSSIGDLFEWDFFAKNERRFFLEDIIDIIKTRYTSPGFLVTEALSVIMTMFTTDNAAVLSELRASRKCLPLFFDIISNMPKTKSFHFQALLVEIVYRVIRMLRKSSIKKDQELVQKTLESLPPILSLGIQSVTPKEFRAGTRQLLNQFNQAVGVVKSFPIKALSFECNMNKQVAMDDVQWFDMGGMTFEVESAVRIADELIQGIAKLHFSNIQGYSTDGKGIAKLHIKTSVSLADVLPNVNDVAWNDLHRLVVVLQVDASVRPTTKGSKN
ncbi:hypothetical protein, variant [Aphanomyces invadans]|uniref:Uncharacterized protein n=1 Tax=Aphanomyces invadans TaxID=157072 RepID=A0A024U6Q7_9STRA|nr:hypothetical protein, variant [Aphanomyces invadans]ETW01885.1 hypothetical protein, variant [Aphanomyces invadans]|eukprot:XP_008869733.1 hypothetical protein, variant [Aphanomyces invadans]